jgi:hypothetical protein
MQEAGAPGRLTHANYMQYTLLVMHKNNYPSTWWWGVVKVDTKLWNLCHQTSLYPTLYNHLLPLAALLSI